MSTSKLKRFFGMDADPIAPKPCGSGCGSGCEQPKPSDEGRRSFLGTAGLVGAGLALTAVADGALEAAPAVEKPQDEAERLRFEEFFRKNYRLMTPEERRETAERMERLQWLDQGVEAEVRTTGPRRDVLFGYAFNIGKCKGYMECVKACVEENNHDRTSNMQYIKIWELEPGSMSLDSANGEIRHEVPVEGHFYMGTQCFHCEDPPCTPVCPVGATWKEDDGIVVVDYDWCIGCRYCEAACPYFGRRFNWAEPEIPVDQVNESQHYLGNRPRTKGVMEKCTFCVARSREGKNPACVEACPTGARVFGNLLDPLSEIRQILATKNVFRLKEDLGTEPKFWYYTD